MHISVQTRPCRASSERRKGQGIFLEGTKEPWEDCEKGRCEDAFRKTPLRPCGGQTGWVRAEVRTMDQIRENEAGAEQQGQDIEIKRAGGPGLWERAEGMGQSGQEE